VPKDAVDNSFLAPPAVAQRSGVTQINRTFRLSHRFAARKDGVNREQSGMVSEIRKN
jgi:hypothetical protein